ncbi:hypothetical protein [Pseudochrobactrum lubricantis]|uniref:hypothetical protein n=1 Tax=Pseudochrobactrum lubricantis TaxID=558172 RepID=UPI0035D66BA1
MKSITLIALVSLFSMPAFADSAYNCGASGNRCQSKEFQEFLDIASGAFPDAPSYQLSNYAYACEHASNKNKQLCRKNPQQAAKNLQVFEDE